MKKVLLVVVTLLALCAPVVVRAQSVDARFGPQIEEDGASREPVSTKNADKKVKETKAEEVKAGDAKPLDKRNAAPPDAAPAAVNASPVNPATSNASPATSGTTTATPPASVPAPSGVNASTKTTTTAMPPANVAAAPSNTSSASSPVPTPATTPASNKNNVPAPNSNTAPPATNTTTNAATNAAVTGTSGASSSSTPAPSSSTPAPSSSTAAPSSPASVPSPSAPVAATTGATAPSPTAIYRVGPGDVLDVRLLNQSNTRESTLYTVMAGGVLDYPLAGEPLSVTGMTTEEIGARLSAELKRRAVFEKPQVVVSVREYTSHTVLVSGLVNDPGPKILRREAVPLYVLIAEAQPRPEAARAVVISRLSGQTMTVDLADSSATNLLVYSGDVVNLTTRPREFYYIGGQIVVPGQKEFHAGLTLTQAVLASGGVTRTSVSKVRISRQGADGRLVSTEHNLKDIEVGKVPDPRLQPGDRVEVGRGRY